MSSNRGPQCKYWCFTLNNPEEQLALDEDNCRYAVWQLEKGSNGTEHYQGYIEFNAVKRRTAIKKILGERVHLEKRMGTQAQAIAYSKKEDTRLKGPWEVGTPTPTSKKGHTQGKRTDIDRMAQKLNEGVSPLQISEEHGSLYLKYTKGVHALAARALERKRLEKDFIPLQIHVYWGQSGTGKTTAAFKNFEDVYKLPMRKGSKIWWDGYTGQKTVLIDEFYGQIPYTEMLNICDGHRHSVEYKGGHIMTNYDTIVITSNQHYSKWYRKMYNPKAFFRRLYEFSNEMKNVIEFKRDDTEEDIDWLQRCMEAENNNSPIEPNLPQHMQQVEFNHTSYEEPFKKEDPRNMAKINKERKKRKMAPVPIFIRKDKRPKLVKD